MDTVDPEKRSWTMAQVKSTGNKSTEQALIQMMRRERITGWRRGYPLFGSPDFVFPKERVAMFVDGCFWHGHPTRCRIPSTNRGYWTAKIDRGLPFVCPFIDRQFAYSSATNREQVAFAAVGEVC